MLVGISIILALVVNFFSPRGLALLGQWDTAKGVITANPDKFKAGQPTEIDSVALAKIIFDKGDVLFVDARSQNDYDNGHIPGAVNRPWQAVTDDRGRVLPPDELRDHFGDVLDRESVVVYCGSGVTACVNLFALALLGRDDPALYPGSWSDWCSYLVD